MLKILNGTCTWHTYQAYQGVPKIVLVNEEYDGGYWNQTLYIADLVIFTVERTPTRFVFRGSHSAKDAMPWAAVYFNDVVEKSTWTHVILNTQINGIGVALDLNQREDEHFELSYLHAMVPPPAD